METVDQSTLGAFFDVLGVLGLVFLVVVGAAAGAIAGLMAGRNQVLYVVGGIVGALALPFLLAALGVALAIGGGLLLILLMGAVGAAIILALVAALRR